MLPVEWVGGKRIEPTIRGLGFESLFLTNYMSLDESLGILESWFSHCKTGLIASSLVTSQGYCNYSKR